MALGAEAPATLQHSGIVHQDIESGVTAAEFLRRAVYLFEIGEIAEQDLR